ncbi:MAG: nucleoside-diphosphate sugar epimerase/dehydratase, partial [Pseudanabaena sp.]
VLAFRSGVEDSESLACAGATAPENESSRPGQRQWLRGGVSRTQEERKQARNMKNVLIIGAGKIGRMAAHFLAHSGDYIAALWQKRSRYSSRQRR